MPSRHIVRVFVPESYYHIYNRGVNKQNIFLDKEDYATFLNLFKRHLSKEIVKDRYGREFANINDQIELLAFCLMRNHFHLFVYNIKERGISDMTRRIMTAYSMYFNKRHKRVGALFQNTYKASLISDDQYLLHISRYIHLNPQDMGRDYKSYPFSSYQYYLGSKHAEWLNTNKTLELHQKDPSAYAEFVEDYKSKRKELEKLKHLLADA